MNKELKKYFIDLAENRAAWKKLKKSMRYRIMVLKIRGQLDRFVREIKVEDYRAKMIIHKDGRIDLSEPNPIPAR